MAKSRTHVQEQGSLFEEDYLRRTLGDVVRVPHVALGELLANAWDAGAAKVSITIPAEGGEDLTVEDDGSGLNDKLFRERWMTLAIARVQPLEAPGRRRRVSA